MLRFYDRLTDSFATVAAWLFVVTGLMLIYEVIARYVFISPTIWAEELSRFILIWATFLAAAALLRNRQHIRITIVTDKLPALLRRGLEIFSMGAVAILSFVIVWHGSGIAYQSFERGRTAGTLLDLPMWWTEASIPLGFLLLGLQALIETFRLLKGEPLPATVSVDH